MDTKLVPADKVDLSGWTQLGYTTRYHGAFIPPLNVKSWMDSPTQPVVDWPKPEGIMFREKFGIGRANAVSSPGYTTIKVGSEPTEGTYSTRKLDPATGETIVRTWNYDQTMTEQPISEERQPMVQYDVVKPSSSPYQMKGAKVLNLSDTYMDEVHDHESLISRWKESVGRTKVDTVVGTGVSGTIAAVRLAKEFGLYYLIIRKPGVSTHSSQPAEGNLGKNWVFVDDLVSSGATIQRVWDAMNSITASGFQTKFKGAFLYQSPRFYSPGASAYDKSRMHEWLAGAESYKGEFGKGRGESAW